MECPNCEAELIDCGTERTCPECEEVEFTTDSDDDYDFVV